MEHFTPSKSSPHSEQRNGAHYINFNAQNTLNTVSAMGNVPADGKHDVESSSSKIVRISSSLKQEPSKENKTNRKAQPAFQDIDRESSAESMVVQLFRSDDDNLADPIPQDELSRKLAQDADVTMADAFTIDGALSDQMILPRSFADHVHSSEDTLDSITDLHHQVSKMHLLSRTPGEYLRLIGKGLDIIKCYVDGAPLYGILRSRLADTDYRRHTKAAFVKLPQPHDYQSAPEFYLSSNSSASEKIRAQSPLSGLFDIDVENSTSDLRKTRANLTEVKDSLNQPQDLRSSFTSKTASGDGNLDTKRHDKWLNTELVRLSSKSGRGEHQILHVHENALSRPKSSPDHENTELDPYRPLPALSTNPQTFNVTKPDADTSAQNHVLEASHADTRAKSESLKTPKPSSDIASSTHPPQTQIVSVTSWERASNNHVEYQDLEMEVNDVDKRNSRDGYSKDPIFPVLRQPILLSFARIPVGDFNERIRYLAANRSVLLKPEVVDDTINRFYEQAIKCFRSRNQAPGQQCIHCCVLIQLYRRMPPAKQQKLLSSSKKLSGKHLVEFQTLLDNLSLSVSEESGQSVDFVQPKRSKQLARTSSLSARGTGKIDRLQQYLSLKGRLLHQNKPFLQQPQSEIAHSRHHASPAMPIDDLLSLGSGGALTHLYQSERNMTSRAVDPDISLYPEIRQLSSKYKTRPGKTFFERGRVFAILWHEPLGQNRNMNIEILHERSLMDSNITIGSYGEGVFNQIRRMIVVRNRAGYCWCVSMGTYSGQGLLKKGLQPDEINAHAVVYDANLQPTFLPDEPRSTKRPIAVKMEPGEFLEPATRIHFGKPFNVEWNVKVRNVGKVVALDMEAFMTYVKEELLGNFDPEPTTGASHD